MFAVLAPAVIISCASSNAPAPAAETAVQETEFSEYISDAEFTVESFLESVKQIARTGDYEAALAEYKRISPKTAKRVKNNYDLYFFKARLLNVAGHEKESLEQAQLLSAAWPKDEALKKFIHGIKQKKFMADLQERLDAGEQAAALSLYDSLDAELADDFTLNLIKASLLTAENRLDEAEKECDHLDTIQGGSMDVMEIRLAIFERRGDARKKNDQLKKILAKDPLNAQANVDLAESAALKKNYKLAKKYYTNALVKDKNNQDALFGLAQMDYYMENDDQAKATLEHLLEVNPRNAQAYSYLAKLAYADNKYKVAVNNIEKAIEIDPNNYDYYLDYGLFLRSAGHFSDAERSWTKAISIVPDYFLGYAYRAGLYDEQNRFKEALDDYKKVIQYNPNYYFAYESIGILALHENNWSEALSAFLKCRDYQKENISYPLMITYCYYRLGKDAEAKKFSESIYRRIDDKFSMDYRMLRAYHDKTGFQNFPQLIAKLDNANDRGKMYFYLGLFYELSGAEDSAKEFYSKVVSLNSPMFFEYRIAEWAVNKK